jgi:ribosomal protein L32
MNKNVCQKCGEVWTKHHHCSAAEVWSPPSHDPVDRPAHYQGDIECIDAIKAQLTHDQWVGYLRGQVAKYNWRLGRKGEAEHDAKKLLWYAKMLAGADPRKD